MIRDYVRFSRRNLGSFVRKYKSHFRSLRNEIRKADMKILFESYLSAMFLTLIIVLSLSLILNLLVFTALGFGIIIPIFCTLLLSGICFFIFYFYPYSRASSRARSIDENLPFAIAHMATIAASGTPPVTIFRLLSKFGQYGQASEEAKRVVKYVDKFGTDLTTALRKVAQTTPSPSLRELLLGLDSSIVSGANIKEFLEQEANSQMFEHRLREKKVEDKLGTFAEVYAVILVAGPLLVFVGLSVMGLVYGELAGFPLDIALKFGVYFALPILNLLFLTLLYVMEG